MTVSKTALFTNKPARDRGERVRLMTWWLRVRSPVEATFPSGVFSPLTFAEACEKLIEWCFAPLSTVFQSYHGDSSHYSCLAGFHQY